MGCVDRVDCLDTTADSASCVSRWLGGTHAQRDRHPDCRGGPLWPPVWIAPRIRLKEGRHWGLPLQTRYAWPEVGCAGSAARYVLLYLPGSNGHARGEIDRRQVRLIDSRCILK